MEIINNMPDCGCWKNKWACRDMGVGEEGGWRFLYDLAKENTDKEAMCINISAWNEAKEYCRQAEERSMYRIINSQQGAINGLEKIMKLLMGIQGLGTIQENAKASCQIEDRKAAQKLEE